MEHIARFQRDDGVGDMNEQNFELNISESLYLLRIYRFSFAYVSLRWESVSSHFEQLISSCGVQSLNLPVKKQIFANFSDS